MVEEVKLVLGLAKQARDNNQSLLLVAPEYDSEIHVFLNQNKSQLQSCAIYSPNRGVYRQLMLDDMREILKYKKVVKKVIITNKTTTFVDDFKVSDDTIRNIKEFLYNPQLPELDRQFHQKRLANFTGKLATIYVGGFSKLEMKERFDRIEDAVCAVRAAREEGMVIGGGISLLRAVTPKDPNTEESFDFDDEKSTVEFSNDFISVMKYPSELLGTTAIDDIIHLNTRGKAYYNVGESLERDGIYEPYLVVKTVLENAISTAALVLTTDVAILKYNNKKGGRNMNIKFRTKNFSLTEGAKAAIDKKLTAIWGMFHEDTIFNVYIVKRDKDYKCEIKVQRGKDFIRSEETGKTIEFSVAGKKLGEFKIISHKMPMLKMWQFIGEKYIFK